VFPSRSQRTMSPTNGRGWAGKPQSSPCLGRNELLIFFQSALILFAGDPGRSAMTMCNQTRNFRNLAVKFFRQYCAGTRDPCVPFGLPAYGQMASRYNSAAVSNLITLNRDEGGE
jgi:hypothetical protein